MLGAAAGEEQRLDAARAVDDPREAARRRRSGTRRCRASRKTGATASWMICATVVTEVGEVGEHAPPNARTRGSAIRCRQLRETS